MKKTKTAMSIISVVLSGFAFLIFVIMVAMDSYPLESLLRNLSNALYLSGCLAIAIVLLGSMKAKGSIAPEIVAIICLAVALPLIKWYGGLSSQYYYGAVEFYQMSWIENFLHALPMGFAKLTSALCMVTSGIRIAEKHNAKNQG